LFLAWDGWGSEAGCNQTGLQQSFSLYFFLSTLLFGVPHANFGDVKQMYREQIDMLVGQVYSASFFGEMVVENS
jgi:hypothetical protein